MILRLHKNWYDGLQTFLLVVKKKKEHFKIN